MSVSFKANIVFTCLILFAFTSVSAAELPDYQRLTPITDNITAPNTIAVDSHENVYVTETSYYRLRIYSHRDEYVTTLSGLNRPISVAVDLSGRIFVGNHYDTAPHEGNVEVYDSGLNPLFKLGIGDAEFRQPNSIAIDNDTGNIYVADKEAHRIKVYNSDGTSNFSFDGTLNNGGQFHEPTSIVIDSGELIVLDHPLTPNTDTPPVYVNGARIQFFNLSGVFKEGFSRYGQDVGLMFQPRHLTVDKEGRIYVTDRWHFVVMVYDRYGTYLGDVDDQDYPMSPKGIAISGGNRLFVASLSNKKVEVYGLTTFTQMEVSPPSLTFDGASGGADPALQDVVISNSGDGTLNWTAETDESWITLSAATGFAGPSSNATLNVGVDLDGLTVGTYTGSVSISAESGAAEIVEVELTVTGPPLVIVHGGPYAAQEGETLTFDASGSTGNITLYEWDIDNDGDYDYSSASPTQGHVYTQPGTYFVKLRITDNVPATLEATTSAEISDSIPSADFTASTTSGEAPLAVDFTNTTTGFDTPFTYEWDFDNDGTTDSTYEDPSHVYSEEGIYSVKLTVTDADGSENSLTKAAYITVTQACVNLPIKNVTTAKSYSSVQAAYDDPETLDGDIIMIRSGSITGSLNGDRDITVSVIGGYSCDFSVIEGITIFNGDINSSFGVLTLGNIKMN